MSRMKALVQRVMKASVSVSLPDPMGRPSQWSKQRSEIFLLKLAFDILPGHTLVSVPAVGDEVISSVGQGLCVLIGISRYDTPKEMEYIVRKILNLRLFDDDTGKRWSKSVVDKDFEVLCVSQFTLNVTLKGNKPDFHEAMGPDLSEQFYNTFLDQMRAAYKSEKIKDGQFGAYMQVNIQNDGPVTIPLEAVPVVPSSKAEKSQGKGDQKLQAASLQAAE